jgi:hypothetical protein
MNSFQIDLFENNADIIINTLISAFGTCDVIKAEQVFQLLQKEHPSHPQLVDLKKLLTAQQKLKQPVKDIPHELKELHHLSALALKLLKKDAPNYLKPLWQRLAPALCGQSFNPLFPELHSSFVYCEASDWVRVREAVENEPDWHQHFMLAFRLSKALYFLNELDIATEIWFYLFWQFPDKAAATISSTQNPHLTLRDRWLAFENMEVELKPVHFPVWMLLTDSKLIHYLPQQNLTISTIHSQNYHTIQNILLLKQKQTGNPQEMELKLRMALKQTNEDLLKWYLKRLSR